MIKTYYATSGTGTPLTGKSFILKDRSGALPDVPMTELGAGHYTADLPIGTAWNIYDGANPTDVVVDALLAQAKEPIVSSGNSAHAYFGNKAFRAINISDVTGLASSLNSQSAQISQLISDVDVVNQTVQDIQSARTFQFGGKTYSMDPISVMTLPGYREDGVGGIYVKANWGMRGPNEDFNPFNVSIPGNGSWVDAFRIVQSVYTTNPIGFNPGYIPVGLLHNAQSAISLPFEDIEGAISESIDFRFSILARNPFSDLGYFQIGQSVIGSYKGSFRESAGGATRVVAHTFRNIGAQVPIPGVQTKLKVELRLKSPGAPLVLSCSTGNTAQIHGQLYPEVS